ncbi:hypothetical protein JA9_000442 [Meyerozyma sp. JA9]|nr:hypothetical protein JA9_000442 [Meyerozyma sp. JA9]
MTTTHYNYNRRHSSVTPYSIPGKHQTNKQRRDSHGPLSPPSRPQFPSGHHPHHNNHDIEPPTLSREFVVRRISEGETGRLKEELKCEACGKGYKHISSLAKHLWEHTPEWNVTKKLLISKHQSVQLLEAASILVGMNENSESPRRHSTFAREEPSSAFSKSRQGSVSQHPPSGPRGQGTTVDQAALQGGFLDAPQFKNSRPRSQSTVLHRETLKSPTDIIPLHYQPDEADEHAVKSGSEKTSSPEAASDEERNL